MKKVSWRERGLYLSCRNWCAGMMKREGELYLELVPSNYSIASIADSNETQQADPKGICLNGNGKSSLCNCFHESCSLGSRLASEEHPGLAVTARHGPHNLGICTLLVRAPQSPFVRLRRWCLVVAGSKSLIPATKAECCADGNTMPSPLRCHILSPVPCPPC